MTQVLWMAKLMRWPNLLIALVLQLLLYFKFFLRDSEIQSTFWPMVILALGTLAVAGLGNVHNDMVDRESDKINKPNQPLPIDHLDRRVITNLRLILGLLGFGSAMVLLWLTNRVHLSVVIIGSLVLMLMYSPYLKGIPLLGNIAIAFLCALVPFSILLLGDIPATFPILRNQSATVITFYSLFAFLTSAAREIIKDMEDVDGDQATGIKTLATMGSQQLAQAIAVLFLAFNLYLLVVIFYHGYIEFKYSAQLYLLVLVIGNALLIILNYTLTTDSRRPWLSQLIKIFMLMGMGLLLFL